MERGYFQHRNELSAFDDSAVQERRQAESNAARQHAQLRSQAANGTGGDPRAVGALPGNDGVVYEPGHHAADYAGFVHRDALERAHFRGKTEQSVGASAHGFVVPSGNVPTSDHVAGSGRKHWEDDVRFKSREVVPGQGPPLFADPTYYLEGGQVDRFVSAAMAAQRQDPTSRGSYVPGSVHGASNGRSHVVPAYEQAKIAALREATNYGGTSGLGSEKPFGPGGRALGGPDRNNQQLGTAYNQEPVRERGDLVGYRATAFKAGAPSMLTGLGSAVSRSGAGGFPDRPAHRGPGDERTREKGVALLDNRPGLTPGYTGRALR